MKKNLIKEPEKLRLKRFERLSGRGNIESVFKTGKTASSPGMKLIYRENELGYNRIAVTAKRGYKNAVIRNKDKRIIRETYRISKFSIKKSFDIIVVLYTGNFTAAKRRRFFLECLRKAGLFSEGNRIQE